MKDEESKIYCRKCNAIVSDGVKCSNCGCVVDSYDLSHPKTCPICKATMKETICRNCGYKLPKKDIQASVWETLWTKKHFLLIPCIIAMCVWFIAYQIEKKPAADLDLKFETLSSDTRLYDLEMLQDDYENLSEKQKKYVKNYDKFSAMLVAAQQKEQERLSNIPTPEPMTQEEINQAIAHAREAQENQQQQQTDTALSNSGEMPKDYEPVGNEPNWIEITAYCQTLMPDVIGYEADISTDENYTKIIWTGGLRYKLETSRLKIKPEGSYHKAIFIIEFEDENYERYKMTTAEVDGVKFK